MKFKAKMNLKIFLNLINHKFVSVIEIWSPLVMGVVHKFKYIIVASDESDLISIMKIYIY